MRTSIKNLIRRVDLEEVLDELGILVLDRKGADACAQCPHPDHPDSDPSFHVCVEDVVDASGRGRLGWYHCWSHPDREMSGGDVTVLVAKVRSAAWGRDPRPDEVREAVRWLEGRAGVDPGAALRRRARQRRVVASGDGRRLVWPPVVRLSDAPPEFVSYLAGRGICASRAERLGAAAVLEAGDGLEGCLGPTIPGVLLPVRHMGEVVSWYVRSIDPGCPSRSKARYSPGAGLQARGVMWSADEPVVGAPVVVVEGIFDADRVSRFVERHGVGLEPRNVLAALGGSLTEAQARRVRYLNPSRVLALGDGDAGGERLVSSVVSRVGSLVVGACAPRGTDPGECSDRDLGRLLGGGTKKTRFLVRKAVRR